MAPAVSEDLSIARRSLERLPFAEILREWSWDETESKWKLFCNLLVDSEDTSLVPTKTTWIVFVDPSYPFGSIKFYPAVENGLTHTFHHQGYNGRYARLKESSSGGLCLDTTNASLNRYDVDVEPRENTQRLKWHFRRAKTWLEKASQKKLIEGSDPFELPEFYGANNSRTRLAFKESVDTFAQWQGSPAISGTFEYFQIFLDSKMRSKSNPLVAKAFFDQGGRKIVGFEWGDVFDTDDDEKITYNRGIWFRLPELPIIEPWQAVSSWPELSKVFSKFNRDFFSELKAFTPKFRNGESLLIAVGFPIRDTFGGIQKTIHWQGLKLPPLSRGTSYANGFRADERGYWENDVRKFFRSEDSLPWIRSQSWVESEIRTRGGFSPILRKSAIAIIGAGSLGSSVAELLVRGGVESLVVVDEDKIDIGNLSRHVLTLADIGFSKSERLRERLKLISPNVHIEAIDDLYPPENPIDSDIVRSCDIIIDCTASDEALVKMSSFDWRGDKRFFSFSFGANVDRIFMVGAVGPNFPFVQAREALAPWLVQERERIESSGMAREFTGCWHAVFPARADDVMQAAIACIRYLEQNLSTSNTFDLRVLERSTDPGSIGYIVTKIDDAQTS